MPTVAAAKRPVTTKPVVATVERRPVSQLTAMVDESEAAHESRPMQEDGTQAPATESTPMPSYQPQVGPQQELQARSYSGRSGGGGRAKRAIISAAKGTNHA